MNEPSKLNTLRLTIAFTVVVLLFLGLIGRLFYIQVLNDDVYKKMAINQQTRDIELPAQRGAIYDRNMMKLAFSVKTFTIYGRPTEIANAFKDDVRSAKVHEVAEKVATVLEGDEDEVYDLLTSEKAIVKIEKWVSKDKADLISKGGYAGIWAVEDNKRVYPYNNLASHVLGFTTVDNKGISGIEYSMNDKLEGEPGLMVVKTDVNGRELSSEEGKYYEPTNGLSVVLTIDEVIQHFTEKALDKALEQHNALKVMAIVMDPQTGEILAMASKPDYNLNAPWDLTDLYGEDFDTLPDEEKTKLWNKIWRNPIVSDTYEPGSTAKLITTSAGLEDNVVTPNSQFECKGYVQVYDRKIRCWVYPGNHGKENLVEGLENSCNPVFIEIIQRLGAQAYFKYFESFGLTEKTGIKLPAESKSLYLTADKIRPVELATMSIGHGFSVTPLQMITAASAIGNKGKLMEPHIVKALVDDNGNVVESFEPNVVRQVISENTANEMLLMMESVVENGSGKKAYIPGIRIGGKTGTSEKIVAGDYSKDLAIASFYGIAPLEDPKIAVLVIVDEPDDTNFGSVVAAPVAREIMEDSLRYLGVTPDIQINKNSVRVPNLVGKTLGSAKKILKAINITYTVQPADMEDDSRMIIKQYPVEGEMINTGGMVILNLE
ncbi:MAG: PASTA domain-containing protein [Clostridia bacterium]|nr:PASTA domain-containing protein [Clostridia bacterium]